MRWRRVTYLSFGPIPPHAWQVRHFRNCDAWAAADPDRWRIVLDEPSLGKATVCFYDQEPEWRDDLAYLEGLPPDETGAAVPAPTPPPPSVGAAENALPGRGVRT